MTDDFVVNEVRAIRKKIEEDCLYDIKIFFDRSTQIQRDYPDHVVHFDIQPLKLQFL